MFYDIIKLFERGKIMVKNGENTVQSVERAMLILDKLSGYKEGAGISKISKETGLHKSTVHRLLATLVQCGYAEKTLENDNYKLGIKILHLASNVLDRMDVRTISRPYIIKLADLTGEVVHLTILEGDRAMYIDKFESTNMNLGIKMNSQIGKTMPLYCTAAGKVLLSKTDENIIRQLVKDEDIHRFTDNTLKSCDEFIEEVKKAAENGYAVDDMEYEDGIKCVAAPIFNKEGNVTAAISISSLTVRMKDERISKIVKDILSTAHQISIELGYNSSITY